MIAKRLHYTKQLCYTGAHSHGAPARYTEHGHTQSSQHTLDRLGVSLCHAPPNFSLWFGANMGDALSSSSLFVRVVVLLGLLRPVVTARGAHAPDHLATTVPILIWTCRVPLARLR